MKKSLLLLLSTLFFTVSSAAPAGGGLRVDLIGHDLIEKVSADKGVHISRRKRKGKKRTGEIIYIHDIFFNRGNMTRKWEKMEIRFVPVKSCRLTLWFRGSWRSGKVPFIHIDGLKITGGRLENGSFEKLDKNHAPAFWNGKKENVWQKDPKEGRRCARVSYSRGIFQHLTVRKGVPVTITFYTRQENPIAADRGRDGMTNIYTDNDTGTKVHISSGRLLLVPGFESCSYYINRRKSEWGKKCSLKVWYREKGKKRWRSVLDPVDMYREKAWRGSIMLLKEDTLYEFRGVVSGDVKDEIRKEFRTRSSKFKISQTIILDGNNFSEQLKNIKSGSPDGYVLYKGAPGFVLKGRKNADGGVIECVDKKFVIFEGLTIDADSSRHGIKLVNCEDVVIRNCEIFNFGRCERVRDMKLHGRWVYKGRWTSREGGIMLHGGRNHLVERCYIHTPYSTANSWFYSHPTGPEAIVIDRTKGGTVIRCNDFAGSDKRRWNDAIEGLGNGDIDGGFGRDSDIYGNLFAYSNDDSMEIEGGEMNVRVYYNRFQGSFCGVSTGCCRLGPSYQFRNVYYRLGDENGRAGASFKNGMSNQGDGAVFIISNSVWSPLSGGCFSGFHWKKPLHPPILKAYTRNNIIVTGGLYMSPEWRNWNCSVENDLFFGAGKGNDDFFKTHLSRLKRGRNALFTDPLYRDPAGGDLRLKNDSPARNRAFKVPGLEVKHLGALQDDGMEIPYRPIDVKTDRYALNFTPENAGKILTFTLFSGNFSERFKVRCNDDFFTVTPSEGVMKKNSSVTFKVRLRKENITMPRLHNGLCLVRFESGFSKPVSIYAHYSGDRKLIAAAAAKAIPVKEVRKVKNEYTGKVTVPEKGCYFLFAEGKVKGSARCRAVIGKFTSARSGTLVTRSPGIGVLQRGSLSGYYIFLDKGTFDFRFSTEMKEARIDKFYLTAKPEYFLR